MISPIDPTIRYSSGRDGDSEARRAILLAYEALRQKGYNPVRQISSYLTSDDPSYITNHNDARTMIRGLEREDLIAELVRMYVRDLE